MDNHLSVIFIFFYCFRAYKRIIYFIGKELLLVKRYMTF